MPQRELALAVDSSKKAASTSDAAHSH